MTKKSSAREKNKGTVKPRSGIQGMHEKHQELEKRGPFITPHNKQLKWGEHKSAEILHLKEIFN